MRRFVTAMTAIVTSLLPASTCIVGTSAFATKAFAASVDASETATTERHRMIVLTDIGADPDDTQSLLRLFLYANDIDIQGIVATTSTWKRTSVSPALIQPLIDAYAEVRQNLILHDPGYPQADVLRALVKRGRPQYGMAGVGEGKDTEGSDWIIEVLDREDDRPLWISAWGGVNTLAQVLYQLRATRPADELGRLVGKLRVYTISDQDDSGPWLRKEFPGLFYIVTPGGNYDAATWTGINAVINGIDNTTISNAWLAEHIQQGHGPLGAAYPDVSWGMEGDTPSYLNLIPNGLGDPEHPEWGGWGGRYELYQPSVPVTDPDTFLGGVPIPQETRPIWTNAADAYFPIVKPAYGRATRLSEESFEGFKVSLWRWRDDFQNDFAARINWTIASYEDANHPPVVVLDHPATVNVASGQGFDLGAHGTYDPDGDSLSFVWFYYPEAGSYRGKLRVGEPENDKGMHAVAPRVEIPQTLHFVVRVTDKGSPALSRYRRVVVTVLPAR